MASVKERLEGKTQRRVLELIQVEDSRIAADGLERAQAALALALVKDDATADDIAVAEAAVAAAGEIWKSKHVEVEFQALAPEDYEMLRARCMKEDGEVDDVALLPLLASDCVVDEELQDYNWWVTQIASGTWSIGERVGLYAALIEINTRGVSTGLPKG